MTSKKLSPPSKRESDEIDTKGTKILQSKDYTGEMCPKIYNRKFDDADPFCQFPETKFVTNAINNTHQVKKRSSSLKNLS